MCAAHDVNTKESSTWIKPKNKLLQFSKNTANPGYERSRCLVAQHGSFIQALTATISTERHTAANWLCYLATQATCHVSSHSGWAEHSSGDCYFSEQLNSSALALHTSALRKRTALCSHCWYAKNKALCINQNQITLGSLPRTHCRLRVRGQEMKCLISRRRDCVQCLSRYRTCW